MILCFHGWKSVTNPDKHQYGNVSITSLDKPFNVDSRTMKLDMFLKSYLNLILKGADWYKVFNMLLAKSAP